MRLLIDLGNSYLKCALFSNDKLSYFKKISIQKKLNLNSYKKFPIKEIVLCSVVKSLNKSLISNLKTFKKPIIILDDCCSSIKISKLILKNNKSIGTDLIADLLAAKNLYSTPVLIFDIGTISKVLLINKNKEFSGCAFFPGINAMLTSINANAKALPISEFKINKKLFGYDTITSIQCGVAATLLSSIYTYINDFKNEYGRNAKVIFTGGGAKLCYLYFKDIVYNPYLTLLGINYLCEEKK